MMEFGDLVFYVFALMLIGSTSAVITARNPVYGVLFLILAFFNTAGLFLLIGAEFIALMFVIVYVGAIAVLFLFVVMMLDIRLESLRDISRQHLGLSLTLGGVFLVEVLLLLLPRLYGSNLTLFQFENPEKSSSGVPDIVAVGNSLYTDYFYVFQMVGIVLLVAMVAAIVLSLRERVGVRRQNIRDQLERDPRKSVELVSMEPGEGMK
jgi:NADH-quinone oxidoreductase subunit J